MTIDSQEILCCFTLVLLLFSQRFISGISISIMQQDGEETIRVLTVLGKKYIIDQHKAHTIADLKDELFALSGIKQEQQHIIINGTLCKDPEALLCTFGANPVCILGQKIDDEEQKEQQSSIPEEGTPKAEEKWPENHVNYGHNHNDGEYCPKCNIVCILTAPFLSKEEEAAYRQQVQNSYSKEIVRQLRSILNGIDEDLAIRAVRACCNDLSEAIDFLDLEMKGENLQFGIENKPPCHPTHEQPYLKAYIEQQQHLKERISRSRQAYTLFVASMKEKSPVFYEMLLRNRNFMERWLFQQKNKSKIQHQHRHFTPNGKTIKTDKYRALRAHLSPDEKTFIIDKFTMMGLSRKEALIRLRQSGNNLLLAQERLIQSEPQLQSRELIELIPQSCREHIVMMFFQSPAWQPLKAKLKPMHPFKAYQLVFNKITKHFPFIFSLTNNLWRIYPTLLGVPYSSIQKVMIAGSWPSLRLRRRTNTQVDKQNTYYLNLIDRDIVETLVTLGVQKRLSEKVTRAGVNYAFQAVKFLMLGKIPVVDQAWWQCEENEMKKIDHHTRHYLIYILDDLRQFELEVAALAETNPSLYKAFLKYEGIYESYRHLATSHIYYQQKKSTRISMKTTLKQFGDLQYFYEYGVKLTILQSSLQ